MLEYLYAVIGECIRCPVTTGIILILIACWSRIRVSTNGSTNSSSRRNGTGDVNNDEEKLDISDYSCSANYFNSGQL